MEDNKQTEDKRDIQTTEINSTKNKEKKGRKILTPEEKKERDHNNYIRRKERDHNNYIRRKTMKNIDGKSLKVHKDIMQKIKRQ